MKTMNFKKGDPVPEWILKSTCIHDQLFFESDVTVVKRPNKVDIFPNIIGESLISVKGKTPWSTRFVNLILRKKHKLIGFPTTFHDKPLDLNRV